MKLIHNVAAKLSLALLPVITLWALLFYFVMVNEINDEADDLLQDISEEVIAQESSGFEMDDIQETMFVWLLALYLVLVLTILVIALAVMQKSMRPLYAILGWLKSYTPGSTPKPLATGTDISEFRQLEKTVAEAVTRSDKAFEQQKQFIGNAAHELQTPLSILAGRIDWLLNDESLGEEQLRELYGMSRDVDNLSRLNRTLLMLSRIDNGQFPDTEDICMDALIRRCCKAYDEIFAEKGIRMEYEPEDSGVYVRMNGTLADILISNLIRNAYVHSTGGSRVAMALDSRGVIIRNSGTAALDPDRIFERFYQGTKKEGSTGLGLALCKTIAERYSMHLEYSFVEGMHCFCLKF